MEAPFFHLKFHLLTPFLLLIDYFAMTQSPSGSVFEEQRRYALWLMACAHTEEDTMLLSLSKNSNWVIYASFFFF